MQNLPTFEYGVDAGNLVLRDGIASTFYLSTPCDRHHEAVRVCAERYLALLGNDAPSWTIDEEGDFVHLEPVDLQRYVADLAQGATQSVGLRLFDNSSHASEFRLRYIGLNSGDPVFAGSSNSTSLLLLTYPPIWNDEARLTRTLAFTDWAATTLPVSSAYLSPAFLPATGAGELPAFELISGLWKRYPCLDIPYVSVDCFQMRNRVKGAYWLNYLGPEVLAALGGTRVVAEQIAEAGIEVSLLANGVLRAKVEQLPRSGDVNRRSDLRAYRRFAELVAPLLPAYDVPLPEFSSEDMGLWLHRFGG